MTSRENDLPNSDEKITFNLRSRLRIILWISALTLVFSYLCGQIHAAYLEGADRSLLMGKYAELIVLQEQDQLISEVMLDQFQTLEKRLKLLEASLVKQIPGSNPCISAVTSRLRVIKDDCNDTLRPRGKISIPVGDAKRPEATLILNWNSPDEVDAALRRSAPSLLLVLLLALAGTSFIFWLLERDIMAPVIAIVRQRERDAALIQVVHMLAHDIRRPLGMMSIYIAKMESACSFDEFSDTLNRYGPAIRSSASSLASHLEDILTLGQSLTVKKERINLALVAQNSLQELSISMNLPSLVFTLEDNTQGFQLADPTKMRRVFDNLLSNAMEACGPLGVIKMTIDENSDKTSFSVLNSGNTISMDIFSSIFEPFRTRGKANGTGLGLTIVKNFINAPEIFNQNETDGLFI